MRPHSSTICGLTRCCCCPPQVDAPSGESKLETLSSIAQEYGIEWDIDAARRELMPLSGEWLGQGSNGHPPQGYQPMPPQGGEFPEGRKRDGVLHTCLTNLPDRNIDIYNTICCTCWACCTFYGMMAAGSVAGPH